jgi:hypothetical protein
MSSDFRCTIASDDDRNTLSSGGVRAHDFLTSAVGGDLKRWMALTEAGALTSLGVLPYVWWLAESGTRVSRRKASPKRQPPLPVIAALATAQSHVMFGLVTAAGLQASKRICLDPPSLEPPAIRGKADDLALAAAAGAAAGLAAAALDATVFRATVQPFRDMGKPPFWRIALAVPYGAVGEELLLRLGLQSVLALGLQCLFRSKPAAADAKVMWASILLSNVAFGAGHLPATSGITPLTPAVIGRALLLNGIVGVPAGYLYWKNELTSAMVCHGAADVMLHLVAPALAGDHG